MGGNAEGGRAQRSARSLSEPEPWAGTVEVLPDVTGLDRTFHYGMPDPPASSRGRSRGQAVPIELGTIVRVELAGRRVRGWVVGIDTPLPDGIVLRPVTEVVSVGPPREVLELCRWVAWRYAGRLRSVLVAASPERVVARPLVNRSGGSRSFDPDSARVDSSMLALVRAAIAASPSVLRVAPANERLPIVEAAIAEAASSGESVLVLCESRRDVERLGDRLRRLGHDVALHPEEWERHGLVTVGTRNAALCPHAPGVTIVLDAHSDSYRSERVPTFDSRQVVLERARRADSAVVFVTPAPTVDLLAAVGLQGRPEALVCQPHVVERAGWGTIAVLDQREEDPAERGYPSRLVAWIRQAAAKGPVVCILNRTGRARLLTCALCHNVQRCPLCGSAQVQRERPSPGELGVLDCPRCGRSEPAICPSCGSARLRVVRPGVSRAREQLEAVCGLPVGEVSGPRAKVPQAPVLIGTQAVLHRVRSASLVVWLDFDQELLAPRYRAGEEALVLLARSVRLTGGRRHGGRVVVRTSLPDHEVVRAAQLGEPSAVYDSERASRELLSLPPAVAMARVDGEEAARVVALLSSDRAASVKVSELSEGRYVVSAPHHTILASAFDRLHAATPGGWAELGVRVEMDPSEL